MKTRFLIPFLFWGFGVFAQTQIIKIQLADLNKGHKITQPAVELSTLGPDDDLFIDILGTSDKKVLGGFKFFFGTDKKGQDKEKDVNTDLAATPNVTTNTIRLKLTTMVTGLPFVTPFVIKKGDVTLFTMDIHPGNAVQPLPECNQSEFQQEAEDFFNKQFKGNFAKRGITDQKGMFVDNAGTVHLFVDHYGKYYGHDAPTVATESNQFIIHLITAACYTVAYGYSFSYTGKYNNTFNIYNNGANVATAENSAIKIDTLTFGAFGPFTDSFVFDLKKKRLSTTSQPEVVAPAESEVVAHAEINIHKLYHVSITTGLIYTSLKNPQNITKVPKSNKTDTTLVADDPRARGLVTVMAIFYPKGRSFLFPPTGGPFDPSRMGIVVGTQLGQYANENFLLGLSHDFATGGAISYGIHFGRRNIVSGASNFNYGTDNFNLPKLSVNKEWNLGFYFGVTVDTRVALQLLKSLTGSAATQSTP